MKINQMLLIALSLAFSNVVWAEYTIKIPLELANGGTLPNGSINPYKPPLIAPAGPLEPNNKMLYTTVFPKPQFGAIRYNGENGLLFNDSRGLMMFVETDKLVGGKQYSMYYNEKLSCVVSTRSCTWGVSNSEGGCAVTGVAGVANGPKIKIYLASGNCTFDDDYVVKIRELK